MYSYMYTEARKVEAAAKKAEVAAQYMYNIQPSSPLATVGQILLVIQVEPQLQ